MTTAAAMKAARVGVAVLSAQTETAQDWLRQVSQCHQAAAGFPDPDRSGHAAWWAAFWKRSWIEISSDPVVTRQYVLHRYLLGTQMRAPTPIKFNGMLYTANRPPHADDRQWGASNWWQNARLPYYAMLYTGDLEGVEALFEVFLRTLPLAKARTQEYFGHDGAFWDEYTNEIGVTHPSSYGCGRAGKTDPPIGYSGDEWNHYNLQGSLDLSMMMLDHYAMTGDVTKLARYFTVIDAVLEFYLRHYPHRDAKGAMVIFQAQSLETWQCPNYPPDPKACVTNDTPTIAGLVAVLKRVLLLLPSSVVPEDRKVALKQLLAAVPPIPYATAKDGSKVVAPCEVCPPTTSNVENTELYVTHPYRLFTAAKSGDADLAVLRTGNTLNNVRFPEDDGCNQNAMDAALLGIAKKAQAYVTARAATAPAPGYRFPAFMPHMQDYEPSGDHLSVMNNALVYMLMQTVDDADGSVVLLPAWPCNWDVSFQLTAPMNTLVTGQVGGRGGVVVVVAVLSECVVVFCVARPNWPRVPPIII